MNWLIVSLVILVVLYILLMVFFKIIKKSFVSAEDKKFFSKHWRQILDGNDNSHKIMEADKLLDQMLKRRGYQGSLGEKLKKAGNKFRDLEGLWSAHKLRNKIAHEVGFKTSEKHCNEALRAFSKAFGDLGLID